MIYTIFFFICINMNLKRRRELQKEVENTRKDAETLEMLVDEFRENDSIDIIEQKLQKVRERENELSRQLEIFDHLYENYICHIIKCLEDEKKQVLRNMQYLNKHPDILKSLVEEIKSKEDRFRESLCCI